MTESNGRRAKGRAVQALPTFTFQDTGITVAIRKVSPLLGMEIRKAFPPPKPPIVHTELGDEENPADPDYERALEEYGLLIEDKASRLYIKRGVECDIDIDAVISLRADMTEMGITLDPDDKYVYIKYICVGSDQDYQELIEAITRRSQPTEAAVQEATEMFQSAVLG